MSSTVLRTKGQITIPSEIRQAAHLEEGDPLEVEIVAEGILLRPRKVIDATQAWFWSPTWQAGEYEASAELERGEGRVFPSGDEFLASLDE
jgi:AbrB family looped-hinge helix DNA binding protein